MVKNKITNNKKYSLSVLVWAADDEYDHNPVAGPYISVTGLLKTPRMIILSKRAYASGIGDEEVDVDRFLASRLGTAVHNAIEHSWTRKLITGEPAFKTVLRKLGYSEKLISLVRVNPSEEDIAANPEIIPVYMEIRATKKIGNYTVGGKYDFIGQGTLEDFKSMGSWGFMQGDKDEEQLMQGSMYRWLNPKLVTSDHMRIQQIITDWSKLEALKGVAKGYPQARIVEKVLPLMSIQDTEKWITDKIAVLESLNDVPEEELPLCSEKDLWQKPPVYKYYGITKKGTVSMKATASFDDPTEAYACLNKEGGKGQVREIPAVVKRCGYCDARPLCSQFKELDALGVVQMPG